MDYATGVVGLARVVNYQSLIEVCDHVADAGANRREERLTKHGARAAIDELERAGLIEKRRGADRWQLIFYLPLADRDRTVQKMNRRGTAHPEQHREPHTLNADAARVSDEGTAHGTAGEPHRGNRTHPVSGDPVDTTVESGYSIKATAAGVVCARLREAGIVHANPDNPKLKALLQEGLTGDEIVRIGQEAAGKRKGFAWVLATAAGRRSDAENMRPLGGNHENCSQSRRPSLAERATAARIADEQRDRPRAAAEPVGEDGAHLRPPLDGSFRRVSGG